ncbi:hypothetical protein M0802_004185 [Mischocyttarus mexicanus]|nr:hypothetical protein M0802_004185 [Mischocyttarus mexicanus]
MKTCTIRIQIRIGIGIRIGIEIGIYSLSEYGSNHVTKHLETDNNYKGPVGRVLHFSYYLQLATGRSLALRSPNIS